MTPDLKLNFGFYCPFYVEINLSFNYLIKIDGRKYIDIENLVTRTVGTRSHPLFFLFYMRSMLVCKTDKPSPL